MNVTVVGIGAMGGGMARALLESNVTKSIIGYDKNEQAVETFFKETLVVNKQSLQEVPKTLSDAIPTNTNVVVLSLVNEAQCEDVCFGNGTINLLSILPRGSCVVLTSTVTATWAKKADTTFGTSGIYFVDCPVSGGPVRARNGDLTLMASGEDDSLTYSRPILDVLAKDLHIINGGAGAGSTVKCVHQLLAGVHICVTAEAMAMGAKAGIDVTQLYEIVNGAAGASWMFQDRGQRMLEEDPEVKSALAIFVKDLDIVYAEAKKIMSPIPIATAALQQFISGQSLGLGGSDDSQVVKVYENVTGVKVAGNVPPTTKGTVVVNNDYAKVSIQSCDTETSFESIQEDVVTISADGIQVEIQMLRPLPLSNAEALVADMHDLIWTTSKVRVYRLVIPAGQSCLTSYPFFHLAITMSQSQVTISLPPNLKWTEDSQSESVKWNHPTSGYTTTNNGTTTFCQYIVEFL